MDLGVIYVKRTKSRKGRTVTMTPQVPAELERLCRSGDGRYVFANPETGRALADVKHALTRNEGGNNRHLVRRQHDEGQLSAVRFCWWRRFLSVVMKMSNSASARLSNSPFFTPAQPISCTVRMPLVGKPFSTA